MSIRGELKARSAGLQPPTAEVLRLRKGRPQLELRAAGSQVTCSGRSLTLHHSASTRRRIPYDKANKVKDANRRLLWDLWTINLDDI